jgi:hypothetical protein
MATKGSTPMVCHQLQEHDEMFWRLLDVEHTEPLEVVTVDAHSDMAMFNGYLDIGNFFSKLVDMRVVNKVTWIGDINSLDFPNGEYNFHIGRKGQDSPLACSLAMPFYFLEDDYRPVDELIDPKEVTMSVITDLSAKAKSKGRWILSIDYDYFSCINPNIGDLTELARTIGAETIGTLYAKGSSIRNLDEWKSFNATVDSIAPGVFRKVTKCILPGFTRSTEEIEVRMEELGRFLQDNYDFNKCAGVYLIDSVGSGFTEPSKYKAIDKCVKAWIDRLRYP